MYHRGLDEQLDVSGAANYETPRRHAEQPVSDQPSEVTGWTDWTVGQQLRVMPSGSEFGDEIS